MHFPAAIHPHWHDFSPHRSAFRHTNKTISSNNQVLSAPIPCKIWRPVSICPTKIQKSQSHPSSTIRAFSRRCWRISSNSDTRISWIWYVILNARHLWKFSKITVTIFIHTQDDDNDDNSQDRLVIDEGDNQQNYSQELDADVPRCQGCKKHESRFVCAGCGNQWYCSRECQVIFF